MVLIPGKTFLVGEYAVLVGGEALGLATKPQFQIHKNAGVVIEYHPQSAVGLYCEKNKFPFFKKILNPYGVGGFGQSTAEFIMAWVEKNKKWSHESLKSIFDEYLGLFSSSNNANRRPSGADLVTQVLGQVTYFKNPVEDSKSYSWPFSDLSFFVISTGLKIQTHEHLETLNRTRLHVLKSTSHKVIQSFLEKNKSEFIENLILWSKQLESLSLQHPEVLKIKNTLLENEYILLVKPCGALGADVCLVFCETNKKNDVRLYLEKNRYQIQATELELSPGVFTDESQNLKELA